MQVACPACEKRYEIDTSFISGEKAWFSCKGCGERIVVNKQHSPKLQSVPQAPAPQAVEPTSSAPAAVNTAAFRKGPFGLRAKMTLLFLVIPITLMAAASTFYLRQLDSLSELITLRSTEAVTSLAESIISDSANSVAKQVSLYLESNPAASSEELSKREDFTALAVQKVGKTGYTALYELPAADGIWRTWAHVNAKIIGIDMKKLEKPLGQNFPGFWAIYTGVEGGKESSGYYAWQDKDGSIRQKFMVSTPVPGTRYIVASTTYLDEFTLPIKALEQDAQQVTEQTSTFTFGILAATLVLVGLIVSLYGYRLTRQIRSLTDHAERISVGDLESEVSIASRDEIGELAEAITLMQTSIKLSISRMRRAA